MGAAGHQCDDGGGCVRVTARRDAEGAARAKGPHAAGNRRRDALGPARRDSVASGAILLPGRLRASDAYRRSTVAPCLPTIRLVAKHRRWMLPVADRIWLCHRALGGLGGLAPGTSRM